MLIKKTVNHFNWSVGDLEETKTFSHGTLHVILFYMQQGIMGGDEVKIIFSKNLKWAKRSWRKNCYRAVQNIVSANEWMHDVLDGGGGV